MNILIICLVIVVAIVFCYYLYTKKSKNSQAITEKDVKACLTDLSSLKIESLDRELSFFKDVVSYFKDLHLDSKKDTPFIMSGESFKKMFNNAPNLGPNAIFIAVYDEGTSLITNYKLLECKGLDNETKAVLAKGKNGLVVLQ